MEKTTVEQKLKRFLQKAKRYLEGSEKNESNYYMILYHIVHISEGLSEGDENLAAIISDWMENNGKKFRDCATEDDFYKLTGRVKKNTNRVLDPDIPTGKGSGAKLNEHLFFIANLIPDKKEIQEKKRKGLAEKIEKS